MRLNDDPADDVTFERPSEAFDVICCAEAAFAPVDVVFTPVDPVFTPVDVVDALCKPTRRNCACRGIRRATCSAIITEVGVERSNRMLLGSSKELQVLSLLYRTVRDFGGRYLTE